MRLSLSAYQGVAALSLVLFGGAVIVTPLRADVIVSNLDKPFLDNSGPITSSFWFANSFTNTSTMDLTDVSLYLYNTDSTPSLYSDSGGQPGVDLTDFTAEAGNASIGGHGVYTFTPDSAITLSPGTNYWIVDKGVGSTSDSYWDFTSKTTPNIGYEALSHDSGGGWGTSFTTSALFEVDGVAPSDVTTPEPGAIALFSGMGLTGITVLARRRKRK